MDYEVTVETIGNPALTEHADYTEEMILDRWPELKDWLPGMFKFDYWSWGMHISTDARETA